MASNFGSYTSAPIADDPIAQGITQGAQGFAASYKARKQAQLDALKAAQQPTAQPVK